MYAGAGLKRLDYRISQWDKALAAYVAGLRESKPVVITGDFNCAREEIDIHNARNNLKSAGFTPEERQSFQEVRFRERSPDTRCHVRLCFVRPPVNMAGWHFDGR